MALSEYELELKKEVLTFAGDDPSRLKEGLIRVLNRHQEYTGGRRGYLYRVVGGAVWAVIAAARRKHNCPLEHDKRYYL